MPGRHDAAAGWLRIWADRGRAPRTIGACARGLAGYLEVCEREGVGPVAASRAHVAVLVRELTRRPGRHGASVVSVESGAGLSHATIRQRLVPVRLFCDHLIGEGPRGSSPAGRGKFTPGRRLGGQERGLVPRLVKLSWIPDEQRWRQVLAVAAGEPAGSRVMLARACDAALRGGELCSLDCGGIDPGRRMPRIGAEHAKNRLEPVVPYPAPAGVLLSGYLVRRARISRARGPLSLPEPRRHYGPPLTLRTWPKVVRRIAVTAGVPGFSTRTTRHLCLTGLARMGGERHAIAAYPGHRLTGSAFACIRLSGRALAGKLSRSRRHIRGWRAEMPARPGEQAAGASRA